MITNLLKGNLEVSPYGIMGIIGFGAGALYLFIRSRSRQYHYDDMIYIYVWSAICAVIGAKVLYIIVELPDVIDLISSEKLKPVLIIKSLMQGGFVFYGGLIGAVIGALGSIRYFRLDTSRIMPWLTASLPLLHAFGRVGCYLAGCCYGINGFPIQLVEAGLNAVIFIIIDRLAVSCSEDQPYIPVYAYFFLYCPIRFILEFFRGDAVRGFIGPLSVSQWLSVIMVLAAFAGMKFSQISLCHKEGLNNK